MKRLMESWRGYIREAEDAIEVFADEFFKNVGELPEDTTVEDEGEALLINYGGEPDDLKPWSVVIWRGENGVEAGVGEHEDITDPVELARLVKQKWSEYEQELERLFPEGRQTKRKVIK